MKISELPEKERKLAEERRAQQDERMAGQVRDIHYDPDNLRMAFVWGQDGEDYRYWDDLCFAQPPKPTDV